MRETIQRKAILQVIDSSEHPLCVEEILAKGECIVPSLGIATVYREIKRLVSEGKITSVSIAGRPDLYERIGKHHHHHFKCDSCNKVYDVDGCLDGVERLVPKGFAMSSHEITLHGKCAYC